jgi:hypothetical protein
VTWAAVSPFLIGYGFVQSYLLGLCITWLITWIDRTSDLSRLRWVSDWSLPAIEQHAYAFRLERPATGGTPLNGSDLVPEAGQGGS